MNENANEDAEYMQILTDALDGLRVAERRTERLWRWRGARPMAKQIARSRKRIEKAHKHLLREDGPGRPG